MKIVVVKDSAVYLHVYFFLGAHRGLKFNLNMLKVVITGKLIIWRIENHHLFFNLLIWLAEGHKFRWCTTVIELAWNWGEKVGWLFSKWNNSLKCRMTYTFLYINLKPRCRRLKWHQVWNEYLTKSVFLRAVKMLI